MNNNCPVHSGQHTSNDNPFAKFFCRCSGSLETVEQRAGAEDLVYTQPQPNLPASSSLIQSAVKLVTPLVTTTRNCWKCPICPNSFPRRQERDKHELTHVPYFMHCPLPNCAWRGNRADLFKKHWQQEDHHAYHEHYGGHTPDGSQTETFDPWVILNQIESGAISLSEGVNQAIVLVQVKAYELQKMNVWTDPWGRSRK